MKLVTHDFEGTETLSLAIGSEVVPLASLYRAAGYGNAPTSLQGLIEAGQAELSKVRELERRASDGEIRGTTVSQADVRWLPAVSRPSKVLAVAMNNQHLTRGAHVMPAGPMFFLKPPSALAAHGSAIDIQSDYGLTFPELEVAAVISRRARHIRPEEARDYVFGYTIVNDVTSQGLKSGDSIAVDVDPGFKSDPRYAAYFDWRREAGEADAAVYLTYHTRSKGCDTFAPVGPWVTTADEIADPNSITVRGRLDGELFAEDSTASYAHRIEDVLAYASRYFTLEPGDLVLFGTSAKGVGRFTRAHLDVDMSRLHGSRLDIEVDGLGLLSNFIRHKQVQA